MSFKKVIPALAVLALAVAPLHWVHAFQDSQWPREMTVGGTRLVVHEPQVDSWQDHSRISARLVVEVTPKGQEKSTFGALWLSGDTIADFDSRIVSVRNIRIDKANFPSLDNATTEKMTRLVQDVFPKNWPDVSLDRIQANMKRTKESDRAFRGSTKPPEILVSERPAILVQIDGEPVMSPVAETGLKYVVNTNWDILYDDVGRMYYLLNRETWLTATDLKGPWTLAHRLPKSFGTIPDDENWKDVRKHLSVTSEKRSRMPDVYVRMKPTELIVIDGPPDMTPIRGTDLLSVSNTDSQLFFSSRGNHYYYLVSGRWFRATRLQGPWSLVGKDLPADFAKIPPDGPRGDVLASVPGTPQAQEAVIQSKVPHKAVVKRKEARLDVYYDGDPEFRRINGTSLAYAVNTPFDVIRVRDAYYACHDGVWFVAASPEGPWSVCDTVPDDVYEIPPSSPVYHTTYVYVYESTPDEVIVGYTGGYLGCYEEYGTIVYGTGYYYPPYICLAPVPIYYPRWCTYGLGAYYSYFGRAFWRAGWWYGPYLGFGRGGIYNPTTRRYARAAAAWGPRSGVWARAAYDATRIARAASPRSRNPYGRWGRSVRPAGSRYARTGLVDPRMPAAAIGVSRAVPPGAARGRGRAGRAVGAGNRGLFAGTDGNIYRRNANGWSRYQGNRTWQRLSNPSGPDRPPGRSGLREGRGRAGRDGTTGLRGSRVNRSGAARAVGNATRPGRTGSGAVRSRAAGSGTAGVRRQLERSGRAARQFRRPGGNPTAGSVSRANQRARQSMRAVRSQQTRSANQGLRPPSSLQNRNNSTRVRNHTSRARRANVQRSRSRSSAVNSAAQQRNAVRRLQRQGRARTAGQIRAGNNRALRNSVGSRGSRPRNAARSYRSSPRGAGGSGSRAQSLRSGSRAAGSAGRVSRSFRRPGGGAGAYRGGRGSARGFVGQGGRPGGRRR